MKIEDVKKGKETKCFVISARITAGMKKFIEDNNIDLSKLIQSALIELGYTGESNV